MPITFIRLCPLPSYPIFPQIFLTPESLSWHEVLEVGGVEYHSLVAPLSHIFLPFRDDVIRVCRVAVWLGVSINRPTPYQSYFSSAGAFSAASMEFLSASHASLSERPMFLVALKNSLANASIPLSFGSKTIFAISLPCFVKFHDCKYRIVRKVKQ